MFVNRGHPWHLQCLFHYHGSWEELCRLARDHEQQVTLLENLGYPWDWSTHLSILHLVIMAREYHFPFLLFQVQGPWEQKACLAKFLIQWILFFCLNSSYILHFCTGSMLSISLCCLISHSFFWMKWWIKCDTLQICHFGRRTNLSWRHFGIQ